MYDPLDTVRWMLDDARSAMLSEVVLSPSGKARKKSRSQRDVERVRYETLCEVVWNVSGRAVPLEQLADEMLAAAA